MELLLIFKDIINTLVNEFLTILNYIQPNITDKDINLYLLSNNAIYEGTLGELLIISLGIFLTFFFMVLFWKIIKWIFNSIRGLFK